MPLKNVHFHGKSQFYFCIYHFVQMKRIKIYRILPCMMNSILIIANKRLCIASDSFENGLLWFSKEKIN